MVSNKSMEQKMMQYKGYLGKAIYDAEAKLFHGQVIGLKDVITFQGTTLEELEQAFQDSIDDYLSWCKSLKEKPQRYIM
jgi:predicted HicB family RNase H-like nuclease